MLSLLKDYKGIITVDGQIKDITSLNLTPNQPIHIHLSPQNKTVSKPSENGSQTIENSDDNKVYKIEVKQYMTKPASIDFDFMEKWNNNKPMPMRIMCGTMEKETRGMVYMKLRGRAEATITCMRCGRELTNPISRLYGIGPECIHKIPIFFDIDINDVDKVKEKMVDVTWEGWIIKTAITSWEEVNE